MNLTTINQVFSFFGNYSKAISKKDELNKAFEGYTNQEFDETLPNGIPTKVMRFIKENHAITIRAYRVDIEYGYNGQNASSEDFLNYINETTNIIGNILDVKGLRIAYNTVEFVENTNNEVVNKLNQVFNVNDIFNESAKEFNIRLNHIKQLGDESYNCIIVIQDGRVTNNATKAEVPVVFINKDINTLIYNNKERFDIKSAIKYLGDMMLEASDRTKTILSKLN